MLEIVASVNMVHNDSNAIANTFTLAFNCLIFCSSASRSRLGIIVAKIVHLVVFHNIEQYRAYRYFFERIEFRV